jgi:hypothetical protein
VNLLRKVGAAVLALGVALALAACSPPMASGVVVEKAHDPAHYTYCGKGCMMYNAESWHLQVEGLDVEGQPDTQWVKVSEDEWVTYVVGDTYTNEEDQ